MGRKNEDLEGLWALELTLQDIGQVRTVMRFRTDDNVFTAWTRKDADKDILGGWTSLLGRAFTKSLKNGSLLRIEQGTLQESNDTLWWAGILVGPMGNYNIDGFVLNGRLHAAIGRKSRPDMGKAEGSRDISRLPMEDYAALFKKAVWLTEQKIYDRTVLRSKEWKGFVADMDNIAPKLQDDLEMVFAFFYKAGKLPFSHFALLKPVGNGGGDVPQGPYDRFRLTSTNQ